MNGKSFATPAHGLASRHDGPSKSPGLMLWRVTNGWQATQRVALAPFDLTHVQFVLLASLVWLPRDPPVTQRHLAEYAQTDIMMTSQVLRVLERKQLLERRPHPTDRRARWLVPTQSGTTLANQAVRVAEEADHQFFSALGAEAERFQETLAILAPLSSHQTTGR